MMPGQFQAMPQVFAAPPPPQPWGQQPQPMYRPTVSPFAVAPPRTANAPTPLPAQPKLVARGAPSGDFRIEGAQTHGSPGLINLLGIESPGLTSSLSIAEHVAELAQETRG